MGVRGVIVVAGRAWDMWVGPMPAWRLTYEEMREVRDLSGIVLCNFTGRPLDAGGRVDVVDLAGDDEATIYAAVAAQNFAPLVLCCHACTPLVPAAAMEKCVAAVRGKNGAAFAQTVVESPVLSCYPGGPWRLRAGFVPVLGARAMPTDRPFAWDETNAVAPGDFHPVPVTKKQGLSLLDDGDLELVQALEHSGQL